jgi:hypothetical protein
VLPLCQRNDTRLRVIVRPVLLLVVLSWLGGGIHTIMHKDVRLREPSVDRTPVGEPVPPAMVGAALTLSAGFRNKVLSARAIPYQHRNGVSCYDRRSTQEVR